MTCLCKGKFVIPTLNHHTANWCTKFEVSSFSHSGDILKRTENLNASHDHEPHPFQGRFVIGRMGVAMIKLCTKLEISTFTHYEDMKGDKKIQKLGGLMVMGHTRSSPT